VDEHEEVQVQSDHYKEWVEQSLEEHGKLTPPESGVENRFLPEKPKKEKTRVEDALKKFELEHKELLSAQAKLEATGNSSMYANSFREKFKSATFQQKLAVT